MKERSIYPCIVDMQLDCPTSCPLYMQTVKKTLRAANKEGLSPEEYRDLLNRVFPEKVKEEEKRGMYAKLKHQGRLRKCYSFTKGLIIPVRPGPGIA